MDVLFEIKTDPVEVRINLLILTFTGFDQENNMPFQKPNQKLDSKFERDGSDAKKKRNMAG